MFPTIRKQTSFQKRWFFFVFSSLHLSFGQMFIELLQKKTQENLLIIRVSWQVQSETNAMLHLQIKLKPELGSFFRIWIALPASYATCRRRRPFIDLNVITTQDFWAVDDTHLTASAHHIGHRIRHAFLQSRRIDWSRRSVFPSTRHILLQMYSTRLWLVSEPVAKIVSPYYIIA